MAIKEAMFLCLLIVLPVQKEAKKSMRPPAGLTFARDAGYGSDTCSTGSCILKCCPTGWLRLKSSCYYAIYTITPKWEDARDVCLGMGGDLVVINSSEENEFVYGLAVEQENVPEGKAWIGLFKNTEDSKWYWVDGTPLEGHFEYWGEGEPNNYGGDENCGHFFGEPTTWNDASCEFTGGWAKKAPTIVCEKNL